MNSAVPLGPRRGSPRVSLAVIAEQVVTATPGVCLTTAGNAHWQTVDRDHRIAGVTVVAEPGGRYELGLHLGVSWPPAPLLETGEDVRRRVSAAARSQGVDGALGDVNIAIDRVQDPFDPSADTGRSEC